ncbi:DUF6801 domain-containing protein [Actinokineospora iranica]|uniref:DUF6801 domain-containing protein n=1 Tax=Actinokineospora iranica TaxID=1271860 RepID=A0A1G6RCE7_9PSEU|nr:DUF6801 domain-containing protein [Actinokineospora iranica]SDD02111.1 hypothetical protein SAMN05216174_106267 [Actinokineospora iranica]
MRTILGGAPRRVLTAVAAGVLAVGAMGFAGAGTSSAASLPLGSACSFPLIGTQAVAAEIEAAVPASLPVGQPTPMFDVKATITFPAEVAQGLNLLGATTIEGSIAAAMTVTAPKTTVPVEVSLKLEKTPVPSSGAFEVVVTGQAPSLTFSRPGKGQITVGDLATTLTPRTSSGTPTGLGTFESPCEQGPGQNNTLAKFKIKGGPVPPPPVETKKVVYGCAFPLSGERTVDMAVAVRFPASAKVGDTVQGTDLSVVATLDIEIVRVLSLVRATTIEGTTTAQAEIDTNGAVAAADLPFTIPPTAVPTDSALDLPLTGAEFPAFTAHEAGTVKISLGDTFTGQWTPRRADGSETGLGTFSTPCRLTDGQDPTLATISVG